MGDRRVGWVFGAPKARHVTQKLLYIFSRVLFLESSIGIFLYSQVPVWWLWRAEGAPQPIQCIFELLILRHLYCCNMGQLKRCKVCVWGYWRAEGAPVPTNCFYPI